jgi:DmsE family decaheme c-type cytochrome
MENAMNAHRLLIVGLVAFVTLLTAARVSAADEATPAADRSLAGDAVCTRCHDQSEAKPVLAIYQTRHGVKADGRTPGCQSCHGASVAHVKNEGDSDPRPPVDWSFNKSERDALPGQAGVCLSCHQGDQRTHWEGSQHQSSGMACNNCHAVHVRQDRVLTAATQQEVCFACHKAERAQIHRSSTHPLKEGRMACSDCHNPHGATATKLQRKGSINETCYACHADKRGPFLWEHQPVTENCTTCHTPHGSNSAPLLKTRTPFICQSCHTGDHAAQVNSGANLLQGAFTSARGAFPLANAPQRAQLAGRNCLSCHALVHGSNHPAGAKYLR